MSDDGRSLEFEITVRGSAEDVWQAIATGPGISSWYVPHTVEERAGGAVAATFGPGPEMVVSGRVAVWEPPERIVFDGGEGVDGLTFEWQVRSLGGNECAVRLVNTGFADGDDGDALYAGMADGWPLFLANLTLHRVHFPGQAGTAILPSATWAGPRDAAWERLSSALALPARPRAGDRVSVSGLGSPDLSGVVADVGPQRLGLVVDGPCPGTGFLAVEGDGDEVSVSVWMYLYGPDATSIGPREEDRWRAWLDDRAARAD